MRSLCIVLTLSLGLLVHGSGCRKTPPAPLKSDELVRNDLPGEYEGRYYRGEEHFSLRPDGTFSQRFIRDGKTLYESSGKWRISKRSEDRFFVTFEPFINLEAAISNGTPPEKIFSNTATYYDDQPVIWIFRDIDYYITKVSGKK